jgi:hypothetical protein
MPSLDRYLKIARPTLGGVMAVMMLVTDAEGGSDNPDDGNPVNGRELAREACNPRHRVSRRSTSPRRFVIAPDFTAIANTSGMTTTALKAFLATPRPKMPNLILTQEEAADIVAYILSLRDR